jgi:hypothetical protein
METIKYQSTLGSSKEVALTPKYFSGKLSISKQLADRPISLPGLTATCSEFLQAVAEVFCGKVVICIDELDKITEIAQLFELLKGIKGILGQDNTHFILTVSEDAMTFFSERLSRERSLVESLFEEIVYLDRLSRDLSNKIICQSLSVPETTSETFLRNSLVLWIFAAGVPREVKRNLFTCYANGISVNDSSSVAVWRLLYLGMLKSMLATSAPKETAGIDEQYRFLICIEAIITRVATLPEVPDFRDFMHEVLTVVAVHFQPTFRPLLGACNMGKVGQRKRDAELAPANAHLAQLVEALIGALVVGIANRDIIEGGIKEHLDTLIYVYKYVPINPQYAFYGLNNFLNTRLQGLGVSFNDLLLNNTDKRRRPVNQRAYTSETRQDHVRDTSGNTTTA